MKILHGPSNIANQAWALAEGLRALGHEVEVWHYGPNKFAFPCDRTVEFPPRDPLALVRLVNEALDRFDVLHFHYARSLVPRQIDWIPGLWDLPLYQAARKGVFFTFHGSDVRLKSEHMAADRWSYFRFAEVECDEDDIRKRLEIIRTYANGLFVCSPVNRRWVPDARFHPRAMLLDPWPFVGPSGAAVPVVAHVPSRRSTKGTDVVLREVEEAKARGLRFEFRLIENLPHEQVAEALRGADVVVDNLLLGDYEVTGLEALAMGKAVIARVLPEVEQLMGVPVPVLNADPDTFGEVLERAIADAALRERLGKEGRAFVEQHHEATVVARRLVEAYEQPSRVGPATFPDWARIGGARAEERLEAEIRELRAALRARGKEVVTAGMRRGPFTTLGARLDAWLRRARARLLQAKQR